MTIVPVFAEMYVEHLWQKGSRYRTFESGVLFV